MKEFQETIPTRAAPVAGLRQQFQARTSPHLDDRNHDEPRALSPKDAVHTVASPQTRPGRGEVHDEREGLRAVHHVVALVGDQHMHPHPRRKSGRQHHPLPGQQPAEIVFQLWPDLQPGHQQPGAGQTQEQHHDPLRRVHQKSCLDHAAIVARSPILLVVDDDPGNGASHPEIHQADESGDLRGQRPQSKLRLRQVMQRQRHRHEREDSVGCERRIARSQRAGVMPDTRHDFSGARNAGSISSQQPSDNPFAYSFGELGRGSSPIVFPKSSLSRRRAVTLAVQFVSDAGKTASDQHTA